MRPVLSLVVPDKRFKPPAEEPQCRSSSNKQDPQLNWVLNSVDWNGLPRYLPPHLPPPPANLFMIGHRPSLLYQHKLPKEFITPKVGPMAV